MSCAWTLLQRTVIMGQWVREERKHMRGHNPFTSVQEMIGGGTGSTDTSEDTSTGRLISFRHALCCLMMLFIAP